MLLLFALPPCGSIGFWHLHGGRLWLTSCPWAPQMLILTAAQHGWPLQALPEHELSQALLQDGYPARSGCLLAPASLRAMLLYL